MARKPVVESADTLKTIVDKAFSLFGQYGYEGVSIGQLATAANLSKGAMYWHFSNKDELYLACLQHLHSLFDEHIFNPLQEIEQPQEAVMYFFRGLYQLIENEQVKQGVAGYWMDATRGDEKAFGDSRREFEERTSRTVQDIFERGEASGAFNFTLPPEQLAKAFMRLMEACVLPLSRHNQADNQQMIQALITTFTKAYQMG